MSENEPSVPTPEQRKRWRQMAAWERALETVFRREWELVEAKARLNQAKKNLKKAQENEAKVKAALEPLSILERAC